MKQTLQKAKDWLVILFSGELLLMINLYLIGVLSLDKDFLLRGFKFNLVVVSLYLYMWFLSWYFDRDGDGKVTSKEVFNPTQGHQPKDVVKNQTPPKGGTGFVSGNKIKNSEIEYED